MKLFKLIFITTIGTNIATIVGAVVHKILLGRLFSSLPFRWEWFVYKDIAYGVMMIFGVLTLMQIGFLLGMVYERCAKNKVITK